MNALARLPLRRKVTAIIVAVSAMALLLASAAFIAYDRVSTSQAMVRRLASEAEIVGFNAASALVFGDSESAATTLAALRIDVPVVSAAIYTSTGELFATYERGGPGSEPPPPRISAGEPESRGIVGSRLVVSRPIVFVGSRVGTLVIRADLSERADRLRRYAAVVAIVLAGALVVALLAGAGIEPVITGPILSLAEAAREVSERNDFSLRVPAASSRDEIGVLVSAFNQMLDGLQRRDEQLREARAELERRLAERTAAYRQAEEANRLKDEFLATLSHELRTPLNAIVGWAALMVQGDLEQELTDRAIAAIDRNARAQAKLIEDVLDVSRIVSGKLYLKVQTVDLAGLARVAVDSVSHSALAKKIGLDVRVEEGLPEIVADPDRLQQVLWNLLSNAIKFTGEGGHVAVSVSRADGHARIAVSDDGIGIPADFVPHVFERFRQADASSTRTHGGLGLGLAIVRHLVEMHGGTVTAESPGPGQGSTFTVILPAVPPVRPAEARQTPQPPLATPGEPDLAGLRVLLLDLGEIGELARAALSSRGADVETAESMEDALRGLARRPADVVVADVDALGPEAERFARVLRDSPREAGGGAPVLAISAHSRSEDRVRALVAGYQAFLSEPVNPVELAAVVASLARRRPEYEPRR